MAGPDALQELGGLLARLPGIGERTAQRLAFHMLGQPPGYAAELGRVIAQLHARVQRCGRCGNFCEGPLCRICEDPRREAGVLCIVARVQDLMALERVGAFRGRYHVLHKLLAPLEGVGPMDLPLDALLQRIEPEGVRELIIATPLSVEGEATALYITEVVRSRGIAVSRIASGMPHGGELEYADPITLGRAFDGRRAL
jgi:recombination protein RecR